MKNKGDELLLEIIQNSEFRIQKYTFGGIDDERVV